MEFETVNIDTTKNSPESNNNDDCNCKSKQESQSFISLCIIDLNNFVKQFIKLSVPPPWETLINSPDNVVTYKKLLLANIMLIITIIINIIFLWRLDFQFTLTLVLCLKLFFVQTNWNIIFFLRKSSKLFRVLIGFSWLPTWCMVMYAWCMFLQPFGPFITLILVFIIQLCYSTIPLYIFPFFPDSTYSTRYTYLTYLRYNLCLMDVISDITVAVQLSLDETTRSYGIALLTLVFFADCTNLLIVIVLIPTLYNRIAKSILSLLGELPILIITIIQSSNWKGQAYCVAIISAILTTTSLSTSIILCLLLYKKYSYNTSSNTVNHNSLWSEKLGWLPPPSSKYQKDNDLY